ncbi:phosphonopyruvate decarboxylase [Salmonella enterica]
MLSTKEVFNNLATIGPLFMTGVPCSYLTAVMNEALLSTDATYVGATSEGEAVAIGAGASLAGKIPVVLMQNSGLGNAVNPLTSLIDTFRIPCLLIVSWRGQPGTKDEPQHKLMGNITRSLLELLSIPNRVLSDNPAEMEKIIHEAKYTLLQRGYPFAIVIPDGVIAPATVEPGRKTPSCTATNVMELKPSQEGRPLRIQVLRALQQWAPSSSAAIITTTGKGGRELYSLEDRLNQFYMVGSMGCAAGIGLGVALNTDKRVVVIDGDGALLMKLGSLATIGSVNPNNLLHIVLDNGIHDSTGGQPTAPFNFSQAAAAAGYRYCFSCEDIGSFENILLELEFNTEGSTFIHMKIAPGSIKPLPRPVVTPPEVAERFRQFITDGRAR